jgi:hypothetical protein
MRKYIWTGVVIAMLLTMTGCNKQMVDTTYKFDEAIIKLPNGEIVNGDVNSWIDFPDGDQIQVKVNGVTYLTHISNVVLINR